MHITKKAYYVSEAKTFWIIQNNSLPLECINQINKRKNAKKISTFDFSTLYTKIPYDKLLNILYNLLYFILYIYYYIYTLFIYIVIFYIFYYIFYFPA